MTYKVNRVPYLTSSKRDNITSARVLVYHTFQPNDPVTKMKLKYKIVILNSCFQLILGKKYCSERKVKKILLLAIVCVSSLLQPKLQTTVKGEVLSGYHAGVSLLHFSFFLFLVTAVSTWPHWPLGRLPLWMTQTYQTNFVYVPIFFQEEYRILFIKAILQRSLSTHFPLPSIPQPAKRRSSFIYEKQKN